MATATVTATAGGSRDTTTAVAEGSRVEWTGGTPCRNCGGGCTMTVIADTAMTITTAAAAATKTAADDNDDIINKDDNDDDNRDYNEDEGDGRPSNGVFTTCAVFCVWFT